MSKVNGGMQPPPIKNQSKSERKQETDQKPKPAGKSGNTKANPVGVKGVVCLKDEPNKVGRFMRNDVYGQGDKPAASFSDNPAGWLITDGFLAGHTYFGKDCQ